MDAFSPTSANASADVPRDDPEAIVEAYQRVRAATERLAAPLSAEDQVAQSMPDASQPSGHAPAVGIESCVMSMARPTRRQKRAAKAEEYAGASERRDVSVGWSMK